MSSHDAESADSPEQRAVMPQDASALSREELDAFVEAFEAMHLRDEDAPLTEFLPAAGHPLYRGVLRELVRVDMEYAWKRGRPPALEDYQGRFPELFADPESAAAIAYEDYRLRLQAGEAPSPEAYRRRYGVDTAAWPPADDKPRTVVLPPHTRQDSAASAYRRYLLEHPANDQDEDLEAARLRTESGTGLPQVGSDFLGFRLLEELGRGAFARVYLARQGDLADRYVALKVSTDVFGESQTLARLQHTNIVPVYSVHRAGPFQAVCMPYFGATTLADVLKDLREWPELPTSGDALVHTLTSRRRLRSHASAAGPRAVGQPQLAGHTYVHAILWIGARLADGLAHAHEQGILHRDLKPANVLLTDDGQPMLLDFNLSEDVGCRFSASAALVGGTLMYMAPEHLEAFQGFAHPLDARSDVYALGVILYELLTGKHPFPAHRGPLRQVLDRMVRDRELPVRSPCRLNAAISPAVAAILLRCLEPEPARRYQSARQLQEDLERHLGNLPLRYTREPSGLERARKWVRRHPRLTSPTRLVSSAAVLALGALAFTFNVSGWQNEPPSLPPNEPVVSATNVASEEECLTAAEKCLKRGDQEGALNHLGKLDMSPARDDVSARARDLRARAYFQRGERHRERREYTEALADYDAARESGKDVHERRAEVLGLLGKAEEAEEDCLALLKAGNDSPEQAGDAAALIREGDAFRKMDKTFLPQALAAYTAALRRAPGRADVWEKRAAVYTCLGCDGLAAVDSALAKKRSAIQPAVYERSTGQ